MPYIKKENRPQYDKDVQNLVKTFISQKDLDVGALNYTISTLVWAIFNNSRRYKTGNDIVGVLECVKQEFYRRKLSELENEKIIENGDI